MSSLVLETTPWLYSFILAVSFSVMHSACLACMQTQVMRARVKMMYVDKKVEKRIGATGESRNVVEA